MPTHAEARQIITAAFRAAFGHEATRSVAQVLQGVGWLETNYAQGWKGSGKDSNNWGAIQSGKPPCDPAKNFVYNGALPSYLAYEAKKAGIKRFIYASSCSVYGYTKDKLFDEKAPTVCNYPYGISKLQGERGVLQMQDKNFSVIAVSSICQPGLPLPKGDFQLGSCSTENFQRQKSPLFFLCFE